MGGGNSTPQQPQGTNIPTSNSQPAMSYINGTTNATQPISPQVMAQQASSMPTGDSSDPIYQAQQGARAQVAAMQVYKDSGMFTSPQQQFAQDHPIREHLSNALMAMGQSLTGAPTYTDNQTNKAGLQKVGMDNLATATTPTNMLQMQIMKQMQDAMRQPIPNNSKLPTGGVPFQVGQTYNGHKILSVQQVK